MGLNAQPSGERVHIGFFGLRNAGKSSVVNRVTGQTLSIVSDVKGTTTDPVQKAMELLPIGPVVIIDTPGNKNYLFEEAHKFADTLITPMSDSLIDLNVISEIDFAHPDDRHAGRYAQYIWEVKKYLAALGKPMLNWIVVGNKISSLNSRNKNQVFGYLEKAAKTYGFRVAPAIRDRVIYKELFLQGLTVLDLSHEALKCRLSVSHIAAKQEIKSLAEFICP